MENKWENEIEMKTRFFPLQFLLFPFIRCKCNAFTLFAGVWTKKKIFRVEVWRVIIMKSEYWLYLMVNHKLYI